MVSEIDGPPEPSDGIVDDAHSRVAARLHGKSSRIAGREDAVARALRDGVSRVVDVVGGGHLGRDLGQMQAL